MGTESTEHVEFTMLNSANQWKRVVGMCRFPAQMLTTLRVLKAFYSEDHR